MSQFQRVLFEQVIVQQVRLYACLARLREQTDAEALHDLRITLRRLRSLLRPLRREPLCAALERAAAALGQASGPLRDLQVLALELERRGLPGAARARRSQLAAGLPGLLGGLALRRLTILLDDWPEDCRQARQTNEWRARGRTVARYMERQTEALAQALRDPAHDRHRLRLLIKRLRYCAEAWPHQAGLAEEALRALRTAQGALGDWHDHWQWLQRLQVEADLRPCAAAWSESLQLAEQAADQALQELLAHFALR